MASLGPMNRGTGLKHQVPETLIREGAPESLRSPRASHAAISTVRRWLGQTPGSANCATHSEASPDVWSATLPNVSLATDGSNGRVARHTLGRFQANPRVRDSTTQAITTSVQYRDHRRKSPLKAHRFHTKEVDIWRLFDWTLLSKRRSADQKTAGYHAQHPNREHNFVGHRWCYSGAIRA